MPAKTAACNNNARRSQGRQQTRKFPTGRRPLLAMICRKSLPSIVLKIQNVLFPLFQLFLSKAFSSTLVSREKLLQLESNRSVEKAWRWRASWTTRPSRAMTMSCPMTKSEPELRVAHHSLELVFGAPCCMTTGLGRELGTVEQNLPQGFLKVLFWPLRGFKGAAPPC